MKCKRLAQIVFCLWIIAMFIVWIFFNNEPQCIDANRFVRNAINNWNNGTLYPSRMDLYQDYITAIGYSNLLQLVHAIFGNIGWMQFINMAMNIGIVLEIFYIARRLFSATTGYIAVILYCLMTTNLFPFIQLVTEIPYLFLALSGFTLCIKAIPYSSKHEKHSYSKGLLLLATAGIAFAFAHTMRPLELAFLVPAAIYIIYHTISKTNNLHKAWKTVCINIGTILIPYLIILGGIGLYFKSQTGLFVNGSMTGWYNIVRSADPVTPISCSLSSVYEKGGIAYVKDWDHTTVMERNAVFRNAFFKWLAQHPLKYTEIVLLRSIKCWGADYFYIPNLTGYDDLITDERLPEPQRQRALTIRRVVEVGYSLVWYIALLSCIIGLVVFFRNLLKNKKEAYCKNSVLLLLSILIFGTIGTALFPMEIRYHYPYTWALTILGAESIRRFIANRLNREHKADCQIPAPHSR